MPSKPWRVLITGASSGIGRAIALELGTRRAQIVLMARRQSRLAEVAARLERLGSETAWLAGDVTSEGSRRQVVQLCDDRFGGLDVLINNAGVGAIGLFAKADSDRLRRIMEVNFFAPVELIREVLPLLRGSQQPVIVNIASVLGHRAVPTKSEYCASKFALHGFSDALRAELAAEGIHVALVSPSTTASEFFDRVIDGQRVGNSRRSMTPEAVARATLRAIERRKHEVILTAGGKLLVWLDRICPSLANRLVARFA